MDAVTRFVRKKRCPTCGTIDLTRWPRTFWMRWFKGSRHYQCRHCRTHLLLLGKEDESAEQSESDSWQEQHLS
jgi:hypothetical protein